MRSPVLKIHHRCRQSYECQARFLGKGDRALCKFLRLEREIDAMTTHYPAPEIRSANGVCNMRKSK